jgi:hypothetical protein
LAGVVWVDLLDPENGRAGLFAAAAVIAAGVVYYQLFVRRSARYGLRGPLDQA